MTNYRINVCLYHIKCKDCKHNKPDPERGGECSCFIDEDLQGQERKEYLARLVEHFKKTNLHINKDIFCDII